MRNVYKFVDWEVKPLEEHKDTTPYILMDKLNNGIALTKDEQNKIYEHTKVENGTWKLMGYRYVFRDYMNIYLVKLDWNNYWIEVCAFNKMQIRREYKQHIEKIIDITEELRK